MDIITGTDNNDTINAVLNGGSSTLTALDSIDGGIGTDTLNIDEVVAGALPGGLTIKNVENAVVRSAGDATVNSTTWTGLTSLKATQATTVNLTAATTTNVEVSGATDAIAIDGGKDIVVTDATAAKNITIGATTVGAGSVTVTDTKVGAADIKVDGGTNVTITATGSDATGGKVITVGNGGAATDLPSGAVSVTSNHTAAAGTDVTLNAITVKGGSTITVTQTADTSKAAADTTGATLTQGAVTVVAGDATTSVTVSQAASTTEVAAVTAGTKVTETASVKFSALTAGQTLTIGGLTFTASTAMTAAEAASAFANLVNGTLPAAGDSQGGGAASKGTYTGILSGWTSGAVSTDTVVFTSTTANKNVTDLANTGTGTATVTTTSGSGTAQGEVQTIDLTGVTAGANGDFTIAGVTISVLTTDTTQQIADKVVAALNAVAAGTAIGDATATDAGGTSPVVTITYTSPYGNVAQASVTNGTAALTGTGTAATTTVGDAGAASAKTGVLGVIDGIVTIDENTTASVTTVTVDGYGTGSTIGNTTSLTKLATLSLANSGGATAGATNATMSVDAAGVATLGLTLNNIKGAVTLDGAADNALKTLNVTTTGADSNFALTAAAVETLTVGGTKKATFSADLAALKSVTVTGSASLVLSGSENNSLTSVDTTGTTGAVTATIEGARATYTGGAGVDNVTLVTDTALTKAIDLGAGDDSLTFGVSVTGSTATLAGGAGTDTLVMSTATAAALDDAAQTFYTGFERLTINDAAGNTTIDLANLGFTNYVTTTGSMGTLTLNNLASNGTVVITTAPAAGYTIGVKDAATGTADVLNAVLSSSGNLAAGTLTAANVETINISTVDSNSTKNVDTLTLTADKATTVNVSGSADLTLTLTGSTKVVSIDGSSMTGGLTVTSLNTTSATTIKGGSGNDVLTAATGTTADVLLGGAGDDTLTANKGLDTLTGGSGNDMFVVGVASLDVNSYATITDFAAGDLIKFAGADSFQAAKVTLADTAVFQDYANAAINAVGANDVAWFQYGGNTYMVMDAGDTTAFVNGTDFVVKLTGLVDLTNASFSNDYDTIAL